MITKEQETIAIDLYQNKIKSVWDIAEELGLKYNELRKALKQKITLRANGESKKITSKETNDEIVRLYTQEGFSIKQLIKKFNYDRGVFLRVLRENNIHIRNPKEATENRNKIPKDVVINLFLSGETIKDISQKINFSRYSINSVLIKSGIKSPRIKTGTGKEKITFSSDQIQEIKNLYFNKTPNGTIADKFNVSRFKIDKALRENGVVLNSGLKNRKYSINQDYFEKLDTAEKHFIFGLFLADGSVKIKDGKFVTSLELQAGDRCLVDFFLNQIETDKKPIYIKKKDTFAVYVSNKKLTSDLNNLGCVPNKTYFLKYPTLIREEFFFDFIHGLIMGDGWVSLFEGGISVGFLGTESLVLGVKEKFDYLGLNFKIRGHTESKHIRQLEIGGRANCLKFLNKIYSNPPMILPRKFRNFESLVIFLEKNTDRHQYKDIQEDILIGRRLVNEINDRFGDILSNKN